MSPDLPSHQLSTLPPAQPKYVLRGHTAQVHAVRFLRRNSRLLTGDADGWVILWDVPIKRPVAVWRAHAQTILGVGVWGEVEEKIITHGRDNKLHVWQIRPEDEAGLSNILPIEDLSVERKPPWLLHSLDVNALNFCSFAMCHIPNSDPSAEQNILIAVPGINDGVITVTSLPSQSRFVAISPLKEFNTGMLMALRLHHTSTSLTVLAAYESGHVALFRQPAPGQPWRPAYVAKTHVQPVLSLDLAPEVGAFFSSSADAIIARHSLDASTEPILLQTKHAGQQSLVVRSDEKVFATGGWDGRVRVYGTKGGMTELAVLKWHKEGCYAVAFADVLEDAGHIEANNVSAGQANEVELTSRATTVSQRREADSAKTHWLAAGSKDGKVSLWNIY
ncbi:Astra associated protein 1 Asa1 [Oleoguttula sp. CCFEE 5521]